MKLFFPAIAILKWLEVALTEFALGLGQGPRPPGPLKTQEEMLVCVYKRGIDGVSLLCHGGD